MHHFYEFLEAEAKYPHLQDFARSRYITKHMQQTA